MRGREDICALCGQKAVLTQEHFVPQCLWSAKRPNLTETIWTCSECNQGSHDDDEYFRNVLVMTFDQKHPEKKALLSGKVKRSLSRKPEWVRGLLKNAKVMPVLTPAGLWLGNRPTLTVDAERCDRSIRKIVKALFYLIRKQPFPVIGQINVVSNLDESTRDLIEFIEQHLTPKFNYGDDVFEWSFFQTRDGATGWKLTFYQSVAFYALAFEEPIDRVSDTPSNNT